jgi:alpha-tubulin suppressor-like RCC1 family protein
MVRCKPVWVALAAVVVACGSDVTSPGLALPTKPNAATALALGTQFSCALTDDAKLYCWGNDLSGQLGDSSFSQKLIPTATAGGHSYVVVAAGVQTACALDQAGAAWCWGDDPAQAGIPVSFRNFAAVAHGDRPLVSLTVGRKFACGLDSDGNAYCWGENGRGQLGVGDSLPHGSPTRVAGSQRFSQITAGFWHVCALNTSGVPYCWGDNSYGELGSGDTVRALNPRQTSGSATFRSLGAGSVHECGITSTGAAFCWGANFSGQLGDGTGDRRLAPTAVTGGLTFTSVRATRANNIFGSTCGTTTTGDLYCWGWNSKNQLGNSGAADPCTSGNGTLDFQCSFRPLKAAGVSNVTAMDVGLEHTCALTSSKQILCWGDNAHGELGDATGVPQTAPVIVKGSLHFP